MLPLWTLSLFSFASLASGAKPSVEYVSYSSIGAVELETDIPLAPYSLPFIGKALRPASHKHHWDALSAYLSAGQFTSPLAGTLGDSTHITNITVGGQHFTVIVDTGSSDLWLPIKHYQCLNLTGHPEPPSTCAFGSAGFDPSRSKTFKNYKNHTLDISYGSGEFLTGSVGFDTVEIGGLGVPNQEFGLVNKAAWLGDGVNSGVLGLAAPLLTSVYRGSDPEKDVGSNFEPYNPFFYSAVADKRVNNPYFSITLNRGSFEAQEGSRYDPNLGYIAFGGYPPIPTVSPTVTVPWRGYTINSRGSGFFYYIAQIDKYTFPGSSSLVTKSIITVLDSGTTLNYVPHAVAAKYNAAFVPPATNSDRYGGYVVVCGAKVPDFEVTIGGETFIIDARDQLLPLGVKNDRGQELCFSGTQDGDPLTGGRLYILGEVFLHNVVSTYNIHKKTITLTQREKY